jgi:restriction system protein
MEFVNPGGPMTVEIIHHHPPELTQLLIQTIPRLVRSKKDVLLFFQGAGVPRTTFEDLARQVALDKDSVTKFDLVRTILARVNDAGEVRLRERREALKRVTEFDDFSTCWPKDQLEAKGLVAEVRRVVDIKDSFTRMKQEAEQSQAERAQEYRRRVDESRAKQLRLAQIKDDLFSLFSMPNPQARGKKAEAVLNSLFAAFNLSIRDAFTLSNPDAGGVYEQIDGAIALDGQVYLVEMKWTADPVGTDLISPHLVRVFNRGSCGGMFISATGYTEPAVHVVKQALQKTVFILIGLDEITALLERQKDLPELLRTKIQAAITERDPYKKL